MRFHNIIAATSIALAGVACNQETPEVEAQPSTRGEAPFQAPEPGEEEALPGRDGVVEPLEDRPVMPADALDESLENDATRDDRSRTSPPPRDMLERDRTEEAEPQL